MTKIRLKEVSTRAPKDMNKEEIKLRTRELLGALDELQHLLYAESKHALLIVIQGLDGSGKDGAIKNVIGTLNPQGVTVKSFKAPTDEEYAHDFLWRVHHHVPAKGMVQVFNRSHYEDILVTRVHGWCDDKTAKKRMKSINDFEELLQKHNSTEILKFYLHISAEEQHKRLQERMHDPAKMWKYNEKDLEEAKLRKKYIAAYEDCFQNCNHPSWHIVPADQNWYKEYYIADQLYNTLKSLKMKFPELKTKTKT